jgi:hypothetical protein
MATIDYNTAATAATSIVKAHTVRTRATWAASWTARPDIHCVQCVWNAAPDINSATLVRDYGRSLLPGEVALTDRTPLDLTGHFVLIEWGNDETGINYWLGFVDSYSFTEDGVAAGGVPASGRQSFACFGVDRILQLAPIRDCVWRDPVADPAAVIRGGSAPDFNADGLPNRSPSKIGGAYVFDQETGKQYWSSRDIIEYLLTYHLPTANNTVGTLPWSLSNNTIVPSWDRPTVFVEGKTIYNVITELLDHRKLLGWGVGFNNTSLLVAPHSIAPSTVTLASTTFPANATQHTFIFGADPLTTGNISFDRSDQVDQVIVRGARRVSVCRLEYSDITKDWESTDVTAYNAAASGETDYGDLDQIAQRQANERVRRGPELENVFSRFKLDDSWDFTVKNASDEDENVFDPDSGTDPYRPFEFQFLPKLPLATFVDYSGDITSLVGITGERDSFVSLEIPEKTGKRVSIAELGESMVTMPDSGESIEFTITAEIEVDKIFLRVNGGPQHMLAGVDFVPLPSDQQPTDVFSYAKIAATIAIEEDRYAEAIWPASVSTADVIRRRVFHVGEAYRKIYIVPGTPVAIGWDELEKRSNGGYLVDDTETLTDLARLLHAYHSVVRKSLTITSHRVTGLANIGDMVATANGTSIGAVISRIQIDSPLGDERQQPDVTQTIVASSVPLDFLAALEYASRR